jgi:uncharacterized iron-regulated membrane protein
LVPIVRKFLFRLHLWVALLVSLFVMVAGITGSILAFEPQLDRLWHAHLAYATRPVGAQPLSLAQVRAAVARKYPGVRILGVLLPPTPDIAYQIPTRLGMLYVNQYTGVVLGVRQPARNILYYAGQIHRNLLGGAFREGNLGQAVVSWATVGALFLLLSGVYLWWPVKRMAIRGSAASRHFWFDIHNTVGILSLIFLLILTTTGIFIGFEDSLGPLLSIVVNSEPPRRPALPTVAPPGAVPLDLDQSVDAARAALPGAETAAIFPADRGLVWRVNMRYPGDKTSYGRSVVFIDRYTGKPVRVESARQQVTGIRLRAEILDIHTAGGFGMFGKMIFSMASALIAFQAVSGLLMWWKRSRKRRAMP